MKKTFTILIAAIAAILLITQPMKVVGQTRTDAYVLDFTTANSSHSGYGDIWTYNNATSGDAQNWSMSKGQNNNGQWEYVKFGGKGGSTNNATTSITSYTQSTFAINSDVDLITVNIDGIDGNYTFTSMKLQVSSSSSFDGDLVDEITVNSISNSTVEFEPSEDDYWESGSYYKILITGTAKGKNNVGIKITTIVFQEYESGGSTPTLSSVTVSGTPTKTTYKAGEFFDPTGLIVTATYSDESQMTIPVGNATWEPGPSTALTAGITQVRATYGGITSGWHTCITVNATYTVTYAANGGTGSMTDSNSPYVEGDEVTLLSNTFTAPSGKTWNSWSVKDAGNIDVTVTNGKFTMPASNVTVTAQWVDLPCYTVTLSDDVQNPMTENSPGVGVTLPTRSAIGSYEFAGWSATNVSLETTTAPTIIEAGTYYPTANITLYPVYTKTIGSGTTTEWHLTALSAADAGVYALLTPDYHAFNGTINNSGHGVATSGNNSAFAFNNNNVATTVPSGICEITFTAVVQNEVTVGYTMYNSSNGYLYASAASSGSLAWHDSEDSYWYYAQLNSVDNWEYSKSYNNSKARLRTYNNSTFRTYSTSSNDDLKLAKKVTVPSTTTYYWSTPTAVETPEITVAETFVTSTAATISCVTVGTTIYYSYDNSTWNEYTDELTITETTTIYAKAQKGEDWSNVVSATTTKLLEPTITIDATGIKTTDIYTSTAAGSLSASVTYNSNPIDGATVSWSGNKNAVATIDASTGAVTLVSAGSVTFTATYEGNNVYAGKTATYDMTVTNSTPDYAILPFTFTGGKSDIEETLGMTQSGLGNDYGDPKLRFDHTDDYVILKTNSTPGAIVFDIKGQKSTGTWVGTFNVQVSEDGETYSNLAEFTSLDDNYVQTVYCTNTNPSVRYIKWVFTSKTSGYNVALGNISVELEATHSTTITPVANHVYVINSGATLILNGDNITTLTNASNLIIEDGGQLVTTSTNVQATVKKNISGAGADSKVDVNYHWNAISSSVNNAKITDNNANTNLVTSTSGYELYRYDEPSATWENYKGHSSSDFTNLENGRGYLYRNEIDMAIEFTGTVNTSASYTVSADGPTGFTGFNLIGNPYTHEIYKGGAFPNSVTSGYALSTGFYKLNAATGAWVAGTDNTTAIAPNEGFLVQATTGGTITIDNTMSKTRYNNEYLQFTVANSEYEDVAYAWFDKGTGLSKINHRNANIPMLYINQEGQDYAIATMSDDTKTFNLNFKAMTTGKYTLSYKANGEFSYLHVIDRFTGEDIDMLLEGEYSFIGSSNDNDTRFIVKLGYMPNYSDEVNDIFAYQNGNEIFVSGEGELQIFDVTGRKVMTTTINGAESVSIPAQGVYIFRLVGNEIKTQKIVVR